MVAFGPTMLLRPDRMALVRTTVATAKDAEAMARRLLDAGVACVHLTETRSLYMWKGKRDDKTEWLVEARTTVGGEDLARATMAQGHPYALPIIESWEVQANEAYVEWAASSSR